MKNVFPALLAGLLLLAATPLMAAQATLYDRLGGAPGVKSIVSDLIDTARTDPRIKKKFAKSDIPELKKSVAEQICHITDGGCKYTGHTMLFSHKHLHITEAQFNAFVEDLQTVLRSHGIDLGTENALLRILAPMRPDVIYH